MPTTSSTSRRTSTRKPRTAAAEVEESPTAAIIALDPGTVEFDVTFLTEDDDEEIHSFRARPEFGYKRIREAALANQRGGIDAFMRFEKMIVPALVDDDGTPAKWVVERTEDEAGFIDPDGNDRPLSDLADITDPENGSSRRRWGHLMDVRDDLRVDIEEIIRVYNLLVEKASERPTKRSKSS